jgi:hypothetical protein
VDVGACDGIIWSNTRNLIVNRKWQGLLIEQDEEAFADLAEAYKGYARVHGVRSSVDTGHNNLDKLLHEYGVTQDFDFLSIDIEGNDYHIFHSVRAYTPKVVVIDFNPSIGNDVVVIQQDDPEVHVGSSLLALIELGRQKGYQLAAVTDWNAIFVRDDLFAALGVIDNDIKQMYIPPFEMRMFQTLDGCTHLFGCATLVRQDYAIGWEAFQILPPALRGRDTSYAAFGKMNSVFYDKRSQEHPRESVAAGCGSP